MTPGRRIILIAGLFITGIILFHANRGRFIAGDDSLWPAFGLVALGFVLVPVGFKILTALYSARAGAVLSGSTGYSLVRISAQILVIYVLPVTAGALAALLQMALAAQPLPDTRQDYNLSAIILAIDGRAEDRLRLWLSLENPGPPLQPHDKVRISVRADSPAVLTLLPGDHIDLTVRLFPPQGPLLPGRNDYGVQARTAGIVAVGYALTPITIRRQSPDDLSLATRLARYRMAIADRLIAQMDMRAGGIAAALLVGDRRFISRSTYEQFRDSGLAHLLAISGLHMGLICFGVIAFLRGVAACCPQIAVYFSVHKYSAIAGMIVGCGYVLLSGASVSAVRAFLMAVLVIAAILVDRSAITVRNVAIAAIIIAGLNPAGIFTAGFQLSFAATLILVLWFERRQSISRHGRFPSWFRRAGVLFIMSLLAGAVTMPFAAQHFGTITVWGVVANMLAIPLTGLWIMPAGLTAMLALFLGDGLATFPMMVMKAGIDALILLTDYFASLPYAGVRVKPPGHTAMILGVCGWLVLLLHPGWWHRLTATVLILSAGLVWLINPVPDIIIYGRDRAITAVIAIDGPQALVVAEKPWTQKLSRYFADSASIPLLQDVPGGRDAGDKSASDRVSANDRVSASDQVSASDMAVLRLRNGARIIVVRRRYALTRACHLAPDYVLSFAQPLYPCRNQTPIISLPLLDGENYLLYLPADGAWYSHPPAQSPQHQKQ